MDDSDAGIPRPGESATEIMVRPLFGYLLTMRGIKPVTRSFDLDGDDSTGYPEAAWCAKAMQHALHVAGHPDAVLVQLYNYTAEGDKVGWQIEFRGQDDLGTDAHVQAMRQWMEAGAPIAFIAKLTGNKVDAVEAIVRPTIGVQAGPAKRHVERREPRVDAW